MILNSGILLLKYSFFVEQVTNVKVDNEPNVNVVETENKPAVLEATSEIPNCQSESDDEFLEPSQFLPGECSLTFDNLCLRNIEK